VTHDIRLHIEYTQNLVTCDHRDGHFRTGIG
jgi:hypothetical protein